MSSETTRREFLAMTAGAGIGLATGSCWKALLAEEMSKGRLLHRIDCTQDLPPEKYFSLRDAKVVESPAGRYREADGQPASRFGYRFQIEHIGRPHVAVIRYPDDKRRYMCIMDGTCYDLTTGVCTDWAQPLSGTMIDLRQVFWPRWKDCSIVLMTWGEGEPAAAASVEIYELPDLPPLAVPGDPGDGTRRELGIQYEDPCGIGAAEGAMDHAEWVDRVVQYARHSGQNLLVYPMAWYHGPQFPSKREPADGHHMVVARDRKQYGRWTTDPVDWYAPMLERFAKEGLRVPGRADAHAARQPLAENEHQPGGDQRRRRHLQQHALEQPGPIEHQRLDAHLQCAESQGSRRTVQGQETVGGLGRPAEIRLRRSGQSGPHRADVQPAAPDRAGGNPGLRQRDRRALWKISGVPGHLVQYVRFGHAVVRLDPFRIRRLLGRSFPEGNGHQRAGRCEGAGPILAAVRILDHNAPIGVGGVAVQKDPRTVRTHPASAGRLALGPARHRDAVGRNRL